MIQNIATLILILTIALILMNYQTDVTPKTFIYGVYLYVAFIILLFTLLSTNNVLPLITSRIGSIILFFIIILSIFIMGSSNNVINHAALFLFVLSIATYFGNMFNYSSKEDIRSALVVTSLTVLGLTALVYMLPNYFINQIISWHPKLYKLLLILIVVQFLLIFFVRNPIYYKYIAIFSLVLFILFTLSDTSILLKDSQIKNFGSHKEINYPIRSVSLFLNYFNIYLNVLRLKRNN